MTDTDPKLVEAVAAALAAMTDGGKWWIAPWEATGDMLHAVGYSSMNFDEGAREWGLLRDAYLKDTGPAT